MAAIWSGVGREAASVGCCGRARRGDGASASHGRARDVRGAGAGLVWGSASRRAAVPAIFSWSCEIQPIDEPRDPSFGHTQPVLAQLVCPIMDVTTPDAKASPCPWEQYPIAGFPRLNSTRT
jgi:hypothetical protein